MTQELVEYRLHRYLIAQSAKRTGDYRKPFENGVEIDATFSVEGTGGIATSVVIESAGGKAGSGTERNTQYPKGVDLILQRLASLQTRLLDSYIDTRKTSTLAVAERRLDPGESRQYPIALSGPEDLSNLRRQLLRSMTRVGQQPGAKGSGNARKRFRLVISLEGEIGPSQLADYLEHGTQAGQSAADYTSSQLPTGRTTSK
jgi:hypothetical protein